MADGADVMWWRWIVVYVRVTLAVLSLSAILLVMILLVWIPYCAIRWLIKKFLGDD